MIQVGTNVKIADNSGAKMGRVFKVLKGSKRRYARIGDTVVLSVKISEPRKAVKKKDVVYGVVVRQVQPFRRADGSYIRFDDNAVVIIDEKKNEPRAGRVFGPIAKELSEMGIEGFKKIASLAPEVI
jgi:large subunit ribosomal protein L14